MLYENIECIIPFRFTSKDRLDNLNCVLFYFSKYFPDIKITICEQDVNNKIKLDNVMFLYNDKPFNKGWGINCSSKVSKKDYLLFWDADMIILPEYLEESIKLFDNFDIIKPYYYDKVYDVTNFSSMMFRNNLEFTYLENSRYRAYCPYTGGIFGIKKQLFLDIGGFFEDFEGWGCEDEAFFYKIKNMKYTQTDNKSYHLYHIRQDFDRANHMLYNKNINVLENIDKVDFNKDIIGNALKYKT